MNIISLTAPKAGSHMMGFALGLPTKPVWHMTSSGRPQEYRTEEDMAEMLNAWPLHRGIWTHIPHSKKMAQFLRDKFEVTLFTRRDPRDIVVSIGHYADRFPASSLNWVYRGVKLSEMSWHDRMFHIIEDYGEQLLMFAPWIHEWGVWNTRYEECIDDRESVFDVLRTALISNGLNPPTLEEMVASSQRKHPLSYRRAKYGDWQTDFDGKHVDFAKKHLKRAMEAFGYDW